MNKSNHNKQMHSNSRKFFPL